MTNDGTPDRSPHGRDAPRRPASPAAEELSSEVATAEAEATEAAEAFEHDIEALLTERDNLRDTSQRLQADFENYRKRMMREQTAMVERATEGLVEQLLPVLDSFEAAFGQLEGDTGSAEVDAVRKGVALVRDQLHDVLTKAGLEIVDAVGVAFDPNTHEAVMQEPGNGEPLVGEVMRAGYRLKGRVLRPAMVKVVHRPRRDDGESSGEGAASGEDAGS